MIKLDFPKGYLQLRLEDKTQDLVVVSTASGCYRFKVLPLGLKPAVAEFRIRIEKRIGPDGRSFIKIYIDDILIDTVDLYTHLKILRDILSKFKSVNLKLRKNKCEFGRSEIEFLGYHLNEKGNFLDKKRIEAILLIHKLRNAREVNANAEEV